MQHCPDVGDSEAIEQVDQGDGEGEDEADQQQQEELEGFICEILYIYSFHQQINIGCPSKGRVSSRYGKFLTETYQQSYN